MRLPLLTILACCTITAGCGTTKWSDTRRTATEQLLISDAMDRAVAQLDFRAVAGKTVYLDAAPLEGVTDALYLTSLMRQHMLAAGCILKEDREKADYVAEIRAGAIGTDRREVMFGVPATGISGMLPMGGVPAGIPELPLATKTEQRAVAKIAVFAYNRKTGRPVWQSGIVPVESTAKNVWVLGVGPFERGSIFDGTSFAGSRIKIPLLPSGRNRKKQRELVSVAKEAFFSEPQQIKEMEEEVIGKEQLADRGQPESKSTEPAGGKGEVAKQPTPSASSGEVIQAGHTTPAAPAAPESPQPSPEKIEPLKTPDRLPGDVPAAKFLPLPQNGPLPDVLSQPLPDILLQPLPDASLPSYTPLEVPDSPYLPPWHTQPPGVPPLDSFRW